MGRKTLAVLLGVSLLINAILLGFLVRNRTADPPTAAEVTPAEATVPAQASRTPTVTLLATEALPTASASPTPSPTAAPPTPGPTETPPPEPTATLEPTPEPSPTPEPQPSPTIEALGPTWLQFFNLFREGAKLPPVQEDATWSADSGLHSRYMVLAGEIGHKENPRSPYYTSGGDSAGDHGNIAIGNLLSAPYEWAFNYWISAPFHAVPMLDPQLATTGFGEYRDPSGLLTRVGATLDVERGRIPLPEGIQFPIMWPGDGSTTWVLRYSLPEFPAALSHCVGYSQPSGAPIILQIGNGDQVPQVTGAALLKDGQPVDFCRFDETNYSHPDEWTQKSARLILDLRDAIVLIPRQPMLPDSTYQVRIDANGRTYTWSFRTAVGPPR